MMHALKNPSFFRPASRPTSPSAVAPLARPDGITERARPVTKLSLSNFRRPSPAPAPTPLAPVTLVQDGSYLEMLSLKLSEAVSKALAQPTGPPAAGELLAGRRPIPAGRGAAFVALIDSELKATRDNLHLNRAILRSLHRPLSVLITNLSAHLLPLLASPAFLTPPAPTTQAPNPNPTQLHALALAAFAGELLEGFDLMGLGLDADIRGDGLKVVREGLVSVVNRVVNPLVAGIRADLMPLVESLETPNVPVATATKVVGASRAQLHPSIVTLQSIMPVYARALGRYTTSVSSQSALATLLISLVWRGLVALSHRPAPAAPSRVATPVSAPTAIKKRRSQSPSTPGTGRFSIKLPPSRPPSPPSAPTAATSAADARALYDLLSLLPRPAADKEPTRLAREAIDEAFDGLKAFVVLLETLLVKPASFFNDNVDELSNLTEELPTLIALPVIMKTLAPPAISIASILGLSEGEYRKGCLAGFGRADECALAVGQRVLDDVRLKVGIVGRWLESEMEDAH